MQEAIWRFCRPWRAAFPFILPLPGLCSDGPAWSLPLAATGDFPDDRARQPRPGLGCFAANMDTTDEETGSDYRTFPKDEVFFPKNRFDSCHRDGIL